MVWYRELFDRLGTRYLDYDFTKGTQQEVDFLEDTFQLSPKMRILDLACGAGRHSVELSRRGYQITGLDLSRRLLQVARALAVEENVSPRLVCADARAVPFVQSFDLVMSLCEGAFGLMESDEQNRVILHQVHSVLRPGGLFLLNVLNVSFAFRHPQNDDSLDVQTCVGYWTERTTAEDGSAIELSCANRYYTAPEIKLLLELAGFEVVDVWGCTAGDFRKKSVELDDFEMLIISRKPRPNKE